MPTYKVGCSDGRDAMVDRLVLLERLRAAGQEHLVQFWDELSPAGQTALAVQLESIEFDVIGQLVAGHDDAPDWSELASKANPPRAIRLESAGNEFSPTEARQRGEAALRAGQLGLILVGLERWEKATRSLKVAIAGFDRLMADPAAGIKDRMPLIQAWLRLGRLWDDRGRST